MSYWDFDGKNGLKGVNGVWTEGDGCGPGNLVYTPDPVNPAVVTDDLILYCLRTSPVARSEFTQIYPSLLPEEQERLRTLLESNPRESALVESDQQQTDRIQAKAIRGIPVWDPTKIRRGR
jgi:hypothetical protein